MRRSAAPSSQSAAKRLRFLSPFINPSFEIGENDIFNIPKSTCNRSVSNSAPVKIKDTASSTCIDSVNGSVRNPDEVLKFLFDPETDKSTVKEEIIRPVAEVSTSSAYENKASSSIRSTDEILKFLFEPVENIDISTNKEEHVQIPDALAEGKFNLSASIKPSHTLKRQSVVKEDEVEVRKFTCDQEADSTDLELNICYYNVLYCKRSAKKHKVWEGDGVLIVKNRSAVLKNTDGKIIDRGIGYKLKEIEAIEEGGKFFIGGKECEIQFQIPPEECTNLESSEPPDNDVIVPQHSSKKRNICM